MTVISAYVSLFIGAEEMTGYRQKQFSPNIFLKTLNCNIFLHRFQHIIKYKENVIISSLKKGYIRRYLVLSAPEESRLSSD